MWRNVGAVLAGLVVGMIINMALVMLNGYVLFPMPAGMDMNDPAQLNTYIATLPPHAFVLVLLAHLGQAFGGGWVAARLCGTRPMAMALVVGALSLAGGIMNAMQIDLPMWMYVEFPLYLVVAWLAGRLEVARRAALAG